MKIHFHEEQRFTQWWLWLMLIGICLIPVVGIYQQIFRGIPFGDKPMPDAGLFIFLAVMLLMLFFFRSVKLVTDIDSEEIRVSFIPFFRNKTVKWKDVSTAEVVNYGFAGGWGIRWVGGKYNTIYNTSGRHGLYVVYGKNKRFVVGTRKIQEMEEVIRAREATSHQ
ncbi:MAG TPA: hypothetical protein VK172_12060 [Lentimicrobium sp.]|nr:hypothetical protein [Lentimicrobium sp.]